MNKEQTVESLKAILATTKVLQYKAQSFHWNIEGPDFFQLHEKFEEYYSRHSSDLDEIAERIRQLGAYPESSLVGLIKQSSISETHEIESIAMVQQIILDYQVYSSVLQEFCEWDDADEVSQAMISEIATYIEKQIWMLKAFSV